MKFKCFENTLMNIRLVYSQCQIQSQPKKLKLFNFIPELLYIKKSLPFKDLEQ